ncbi:MAG TPA: hypothetical protein VLC09_14515 [Polyangiaceae bacterium]|nr:hypothetical protein [Polyangiaceae bacterium]
MKVPFATLCAGSLAVCTWLSPSVASAHNNVEFAAQGGLNLSGNLPLTLDRVDGAASFDPAFLWSVLAGYRLEQEGFIFLQYSRSETTGYFRPNGEITATGSQGIAFDWFQFGGYLESWRGPLAGLLGFSLGAMRTSAVGGGQGNDVSFSAVVEGGAKVEILRNLHLRFTARMPINFVSGESEVFCVTGAGCLATLHGDPLIQGQLLGGIGFGF